MNVTELRPGNYFLDEGNLYQVMDILLNKTARTCGWVPAVGSLFRVIRNGVNLLHHDLLGLAVHHDNVHALLQAVQAATVNAVDSIDLIGSNLSLADSVSSM